MRCSVLDISPVPPNGTATDAFRQSGQLIAAAERAGYERYWVAEHHGIGYRNAGSAPEVLIAHLATLTTRIRVGSGAVLLDKYRPYKVADTFRALHALFPGRIDLGVGRGSSPAPVEAALRAAGDGDGGDGGDNAGDPAFAALAGQLGLRYCFAAFLNPRDAPSVFSVYRAAFRASGLAGAPVAPRAMLAVSAACARTDEEADLLRAGAELHARRVRDRDPAVDLPLPGPAQALAALGHAPGPADVEPGNWPRHLSGSPQRLRGQLTAITAEAGADELMICDLIGDHAARLRSYELLAGALRPAPASSRR